VKTVLCVVVALSGVALHAAGGSPGLIDAVKQGNVAAVRGLVARHANVNAAEPDGMTALHWAARGGHAEMAQLLVRGGADVNAANRYGVTPLSLAVQTGESRLVNLLLEAGADANLSSSEGQTPIMTAARTGNPEVIRSLAGYGADVNAREGWQGQTAIMWAATKNHAAAIATLVELGADQNARSKILQFPEFKFETSGNPITALPRGGWTPLMYAAREGAIDAARALADAGADLNATDPDGTTALARQMRPKRSPARIHRHRPILLIFRRSMVQMRPKRSPARRQTRPKRSPARRPVGASRPACIAPRSPRSWTPG